MRIQTTHELVVLWYLTGNTRSTRSSPWPVEHRNRSLSLIGRSRAEYVGCAQSEDEESDAGGGAAPAAAPPVAARSRAVRGAAATKKNYVIELSDSEEDGEDSGSDFDDSS